MLSLSLSLSLSSLSLSNCSQMHIDDSIESAIHCLHFRDNEILADKVLAEYAAILVNDNTDLFIEKLIKVSPKREDFMALINNNYC